ncbi:unnamed protein product, partial [marine sediment metagenome]
THPSVIPAKAGIQKKNIDNGNKLSSNILYNIKNQYCIYILANKRNGTLYIGVTSNLVERVYEHKNNMIEGFSKKYNIHKLVYYEITNDIESAIRREKKLKKWNRKWKINLIENSNP